MDYNILHIFIFSPKICVLCSSSIVHPGILQIKFHLVVTPSRSDFVGKLVEVETKYQVLLSPVTIGVAVVNGDIGRIGYFFTSDCNSIERIAVKRNSWRQEFLISYRPGVIRPLCSQKKFSLDV